MRNHSLECRETVPEEHLIVRRVSEEQVYFGSFDILDREKDRVRHETAKRVASPLASGKTIMACVEVEQLHRPQDRFIELRGRLHLMECPPEMMRRTAYKVPVERVEFPIEVEKPVELMPAQKIIGGIARKFWNHLASMTKELEYDGPRG